MNKEQIIAEYELNAQMMQAIKEYNAMDEDDEEVILDKHYHFIMNNLRANYKSYSLEVLLEAIYATGGCPNLINDDNGRVTLAEILMCPVAIDPLSGVTLPVTIEEDQKWFNTTKEAVWYYIETMFES